MRGKVVKFIRENKESFLIRIVIKTYFKILGLSPKNMFVRVQTFCKCKRKSDYIKLKFCRRKNKEVILDVDKTKLYFPDSDNALMFINEQETFDNYKELNNLDCVLDLGANVGDSTYYLQKRNKKVICYEASPFLFSYLKSNVENWKNKNIEIHNKFINVGNKKFSEKELKEIWEEDLEQVRKVKTTNINDVLKNYNIDGLKMDIEGGEYPIIKYFLKNKDKFNFRKGTIEFHFLASEKERNEIFLKFLKFLKMKNYKYYFFDNQHRKVSEKRILKKINGTFYLTNIYFYKP